MKDMRQLILYIIFLMSMVFPGYGEVSAASISCQDLKHQTSCQNWEHQASCQNWKHQASCQDNKEQVSFLDGKQQKQAAQLEDASQLAHRVCSNRPQRLLPSGNIHGGNGSASRLLFNRTRFLSSLLSTLTGGVEPFRKETAPIHFDVASKYYIICLRHLRC